MGVASSGEEPGTTFGTRQERFQRGASTRYDVVWRPIFPPAAYRIRAILKVSVCPKALTRPKYTPLAAGCPR
jgi:hypothetical protein